jgi:hypothetical protein
VLLVVAATVGCGATPAVEDAALRIPPGRYAEAFEVAVASARALGLPPEVRDRGAGLVETETQIAGSLLEPWLWGEETLPQAVENTLLFQRRRARIEFSAVDAPATPPLSEDGVLPGPALPGADRPAPLDLGTVEGPIEVRVRVIVERAFVPGIKRNDWSRLLTSRYEDPLRPNLETWTPVGRDPHAERRILQAIERALRE